jgi:hypothetical protein
MEKRFRIYTGPTLVESVATHLREAYSRVLAGTENVYVYTTADRDMVLAKLRTKFSGFKLQDIQLIREEEDSVAEAERYYNVQ